MRVHLLVMFGISELLKEDRNIQRHLAKGCFQGHYARLRYFYLPFCILAIAS